MPLNPGEVEKGRLIDILRKEGVAISESIEDGTVLQKGPDIFPVRAYGTPARFSKRHVKNIARKFNIDPKKFGLS